MKYIQLLLLGLLTQAPLVSQNSILTDLTAFDTEFAFEIRYATVDNFLKQKVYPCAKCLLLPEVAAAIKQANHDFCELGYKIKFYDCYRPVAVQKKMWAIYPNPSYVGNPYRKGSIHNRGAAVDLTIVKLDGSPLDMGSDYDFFGKEAHIDYPKHKPEVVKNRQLLWDIMKKNGFSPIRTEWWHFNYDAKNYGLPVLNQGLNCTD